VDEVERDREAAAETSEREAGRERVYMSMSERVRETEEIKRE